MGRHAPQPDDERSERILDIAIALAEADGYAAVRLREIAERAGVALGTVYRRFASKEDILVAALAREAARLEVDANALYALPGDRADRVVAFFEIATRLLVSRPHLARATLRAVSSGEPAVADKVLRFHGRMTALLVRVLRGRVDIGERRPPSPDEETLATLLQQIWFASLVGWSGGLHDTAGVLDRMRDAARLLLR